MCFPRSSKGCSCITLYFLQPRSCGPESPCRAHCKRRQPGDLLLPSLSPRLCRVRDTHRHTGRWQREGLTAGNTAGRVVLEPSSLFFRLRVRGARLSETEEWTPEPMETKNHVGLPLPGRYWGGSKPGVLKSDHVRKSRSLWWCQICPPQVQGSYEDPSCLNFLIQQRGKPHSN